MYSDGLTKVVIETFKALAILRGSLESMDDDDVDLSKSIEDQDIVVIKDGDNDRVYEKDPNSPDDVEVFNIK